MKRVSNIFVIISLFIMFAVSCSVNQSGVSDSDVRQSYEKGTIKEKPVVNDSSDVVVLYSTENKGNTKGVGSSAGDGYIYDLKTSVRDHNDAPNTMGGYTKIPVDLNEGAGGKYIYLYYNKIPYPADDAICMLHIKSNPWWWGPILLTSSPEFKKLGESFDNGGWTDLNQGSGGDFMYLEGATPERIKNFYNWFIFIPVPYHASELELIRDIVIVSSPYYLGGSYNGWTLLPDDLNENAGGKFIQIGYKK